MADSQISLLPTIILHQHKYLHPTTKKEQLHTVAFYPVQAVVNGAGAGLDGPSSVWHREAKFLYSYTEQDSVVGGPHRSAPAISHKATFSCCGCLPQRGGLFGSCHLPLSCGHEFR